MIGKNIAYHRKIQGLSQRKLADELGVSNTYISQIENEKTSPNNKMLEKISKVLGVKTEDLKDKAQKEDDKIVSLLLELTKKNKIKWDIEKRKYGDYSTVTATLKIGELGYVLQFHLDRNQDVDDRYILFYKDNLHDEKRHLESNLIEELILELRADIDDTTSKHNQISILNRLLED